jgi:hypothetical protein
MNLSTLFSEPSRSKRTQVPVCRSCSSCASAVVKCSRRQAKSAMFQRERSRNCRRRRKGVLANSTSCADSAKLFSQLPLWRLVFRRLRVKRGDKALRCRRDMRLVSNHNILR